MSSPSEHFGSNTLGLAVGSGHQGRPRCGEYKELAVSLSELGELKQMGVGLIVVCMMSVWAKVF